MKIFLLNLFSQTIRTPAQAAMLLQGQGLDRTTGWMILGLAVALNTLLYFLSLALFPVPAEMMLPLLQTPFLVATVLGSTVVVLVFVFFWAGRSLGGNAPFDDILLMVGWLQYMRLAIQLGSLVLMLFIPNLAWVFVLGTAIYGLWVVINFLNVAHGFGSLAKSVMLLLLSLVGLMVGMSLIVSLFTASAIGMS